MVQHEVVEDDDAGPRAQPLDDPAVNLGVVADVVERDVARRRAAARRDLDVDALAERRHEQRRVVGDARSLGRHRAVVRDAHARSSSLSASASMSFSAASLNMRCSYTIGSTYQRSSGCKRRFT